MNKPTEHSRWFSHYGQNPQGQARIFVFPYSGAGASIYHQWAQECQDGRHDFIGVQLPGRENRLREAAYSDIKLLLQALVPAITPLLDKPFIFFGHSLGALIAFELCRALRRQNLPQPKHLFISAFRAPELPNPNRELHALPLPEMLTGLREYAGTPEEILANEDMMALFLPLLRADFSLHETYNYQHEQPLSCPITTLSATHDTIVPATLMPNWQQQTYAGFHHYQFTGDHFFINEHCPTILNHLRQACT